MTGKALYINSPSSSRYSLSNHLYRAGLSICLYPTPPAECFSSVMTKGRGGGREEGSRDWEWPGRRGEAGREAGSTKPTPVNTHPGILGPLHWVVEPVHWAVGMWHCISVRASCAEDEDRIVQPRGLPTYCIQCGQDCLIHGSPEGVRTRSLHLESIVATLSSWCCVGDASTIVDDDFIYILQPGQRRWQYHTQTPISQPSVTAWFLGHHVPVWLIYIPPPVYIFLYWFFLFFLPFLPSSSLGSLQDQYLG